ncbi:sensor histidine kinase [Streptomyces sp. NPDC001941]|uniref:sensor histidine kinase n=1 Tax=Streptomyces sp. NPDC001941 TaxID=3154659 RepID=UPI00331654FC
MNRRQALVKLGWIGIWLAFMGAPVSDLFDREHAPLATALGWAGLVVFVTVYLTLVFVHTSRPVPAPLVRATLLFLLVLAVVLSLSLGSEWLVLFVYVSVSCGAVLPMGLARWAILVVTALMVAIGMRTDDPAGILGAVTIPALLGGFSMTGVRQLVRTTVELREARATVAQLAANEERLRLARDLHDLLGHSLSLITLKSELAGRMLPAHPDQAAQQVADIERVSRQALVDVREAVTGYRRLTLPGELAGARTALAAAGIAADVPTGAPPLAEDREEALAWTLREAVTNVVRHSGARRCVVGIDERQTLDGRFTELTVTDDGRGAAGGSTPGNGLTGLRERLEAVGGALDASGGRSGFTLTARVPLEPGHDLGSDA